MKTPKDVEIGDAVTFVDSQGRAHAAVVTAAWRQFNEAGERVGEAGSINLVYVSGNKDEEDTYGRQIKRETSLVHQSRQSAPGMYWK